MHHILFYMSERCIPAWNNVCHLPCWLVHWAVAWFSPASKKFSSHQLAYMESACAELQHPLFKICTHHMPFFQLHLAHFPCLMAILRILQFQQFSSHSRLCDCEIGSCLNVTLYYTIWLYLVNSQFNLNFKLFVSHRCDITQHNVSLYLRVSL